MPYIDAPPAARFRDRLASSASYLILALAGLWVTGYGGWLPWVTAVLLVLGGGVASLGAVKDHYQIEWLAMPVITGGAVGLLTISILWASTQAPEATAVAFLALYAVVMLLQRWNRLVNIASKDRTFNRLRRRK